MRLQVALAYLAVLVGAAVPWLEVAVVIPAGIAAGLNPVAVAVLALVGNTATLLALLVAHGRVAVWLRRRRSARRGEAEEGPSRSRRAQRARRVFDRWGLPGLALLAPISIGTHTAALLAASLGPPRQRVAVWMVIGLVVWTAVITPVAVVGLELL